VLTPLALRQYSAAMSLRTLKLAALCLVLAACAHTPAASPPGAEARLARVMIEALAPDSLASGAYRWDALSIRISRHMHWQLANPDPAGRGADAPIRRNGWIANDGVQIGVSAHGGEAGVAALSFESVQLSPAALVAALEQEHAQLTPRPGQEDAYVISAPGRRPASLSFARICRPEQSRAGPSCRSVFTLAFAQH